MWPCMGLKNCDDKRVGIAVSDDENGRQDVTDAVRCAEAVEGVLRQAVPHVEIFKVNRDILDRPDAAELFIRKKWTEIYNLFEGFSSDASAEIVFAELLEKLNIPFTGNSSNALRNCLNKSEVKKILSDAGITVPRGIFIQKKSDKNAFLKENLAPPFFVKPCFEDASVGIDAHSFITDTDAAWDCIMDKLKNFPRGVIVEEFIPGNEYNVGLFRASAREIIGISVVEYTLYPRFLPFVTYAAKWDADSLEYKTIIPRVCAVSELGKKRKDALVKLAVESCEVLGCNGYARVDIRQKGEGFYVIDVNPNPDLNVDSGFTRQAFSRGYSYGDMIMKIFSSGISH